MREGRFRFVPAATVIPLSLAIVVCIAAFSQAQTTGLVRYAIGTIPDRAV